VSRTKYIALGSVLAASLVPSSAALAQGGPHLSRGELQGVPARVAKRLKRVERALNRAEDAIDDGDSAAAVTLLGAVDKNLARALKAVNHRLDDSEVTGAFASVTDDVIETTAADFDGQDSPVVEALASSLGGAIDARDSSVGSIDDSDVLSDIADDASTEGDDIAEALSDDELTSGATSALQSAATKVAATETAASDAADAADAGADDESGDDESGDCPQGHGGPHGDGGPNEDDSDA
jgi:hypothetical protein